MYKTKQILLFFFLIIISSQFILADITLEPKLICNPYEETNSVDLGGSGIDSARSGTGGLGINKDNLYVDWYYDLSNYTNFDNASFQWQSWERASPTSALTLYVDFCSDYVESESCNVTFDDHQSTFSNCTNIQTIRHDLITDDVYNNLDILNLIENDNDKKFVIVAYLSPFSFDTQQRSVKIHNEDSLYPPQLLFSASTPVSSNEAPEIPLIQNRIHVILDRDIKTIEYLVSDSDDISLDCSLYFSNESDFILPYSLISPVLADTQTNILNNTIQGFTLDITGYQDNDVDQELYYQLNCTDGEDYTLSQQLDLRARPLYLYGENDISSAVISLMAKISITVGILISVLVFFLVFNFINSGLKGKARFW